MPEFDTRVGAYGVIVEEGKILLAHWNAMGSSNWTLPGGGLEMGEAPESAACREIFEETGFQVRLEVLLGTDNQFYPPEHHRPRSLHAFRVLYLARIIGGELRHELDGTTDKACWFDLNEVEKLDRASLVDAGLRFWRNRVEEVRGASDTV